MLLIVRIALLILAFLALLWMLFPMIHEQGTEMGFAAGGPDPNVYKTTYLFGWPLTWITWERSWNQAEGYDESEVAAFHALNLVAHLLVIAAPLLLFGLGSRDENRKPSALPKGGGE
jgi:hypothetical protein